MNKKFIFVLVILFALTGGAFAQVSPDYSCSDTNGLFPLYYWQPAESTMIVRWCYGDAIYDSLCWLDESDIVIPDFVHPGTSITYSVYDSVDLSQASDKLDIFILYDRSDATFDDSKGFTQSLFATVNEQLIEIIRKRLNDDEGGTCFYENIHIYFIGYASPGEIFFYPAYLSGSVSEPYCSPALFGAVFFDFCHYTPSRKFNQTGNDPFGALLWLMENINDDNLPEMRANAEKVIFTITNTPPRSDSAGNEPLSGSDSAIMNSLINIAHGVIDTVDSSIVVPKWAFQVFFFAPTIDFNSPYADTYFYGWRDFWDGDYSGYYDWGVNFEKGDTANNSYFIPIVTLHPRDSVWVPNDSSGSHDNFSPLRDKLSDILHKHLVRVWYGKGSGVIGEDNVIGMDTRIEVIPNPFNSSCFIKAEKCQGIEIYDLEGNKIKEFRDSPYVWQPEESVRSGLYIVRIKTMENEFLSKKVLYVH